MLEDRMQDPRPPAGPRRGGGGAALAAEEAAEVLSADALSAPPSSGGRVVLRGHGADVASSSYGCDGSGGAGGGESGASASVRQVVAQTIFSLIDQLEKWVAAMSFDDDALGSVEDKDEVKRCLFK